MEAKIATSLIIGRTMKIDRPSKPGDGDDTVTCSIGFKGLRVPRDFADELAGWPIGCTNMMYNELGAPYTHTEIKVPKRALMVSGKIEHRRDSGSPMATLKLPDKKSAAGALHFMLDVPDDKGPTVSISGTIMWKAAGDEVDEVRPLLRQSCWAELKFTDENLTRSMFPNPERVDPEKAAGDRAKLDRKQRAAGEKPEADDAPAAPAAADGKDELHDKAIQLIRPEASVSVSWLQRQLKVGYNRAARIIEALEKEKMIGPLRSEGGHEVLIPRAAAKPAENAGKGKVVDLSVSRLEREAKEHARKHPRKDPPRGGSGGPRKH